MKHHKPTGTPYLPFKPNHLEFNWFAVEDKNGNPHQTIEFLGTTWKLKETNSNHMTATYKQEQQS